MYQQQQYGQYQQYGAPPPAPHYGDVPPIQQYSSQQYSPPPPQQYSSPPPQQYQQGYDYNQSGYYQPPQQTYQTQPQSDYDPSRPIPPQQAESHLFCHLPRPFGIWSKYVYPYEETLIVQNPCDFRTEDIEIKNQSRHEVLFKCSSLHKAHAKDYPHREGKPAECILRSAASGEELIIIGRHDTDQKKLTNDFSLEDAKDGSIIAWAAGDGATQTKTTYNIFVFNRLSKPHDLKDGEENIAKIRVEGNFLDDHLDFKFENTENRFAMLRNDYEQSGGPVLKSEQTGTRVAAGFDLAVIAGLQIVMDLHNTEFCEEGENDARQHKFAGQMGRALGKGLVKGLFAAAGGGGGN